MTTNLDFDQCVGHKRFRYLPEESTITVSFPPEEEVAVGLSISRRKVKCSLSASVSVSKEDRETIDSAVRDSSSLESGSGFVKATEDSIPVGTNMEEMFAESISVSKKSSKVSEKMENFGEEGFKMKGINSRNVSLPEVGSGFSGESVNFDDEVHKREENDKIVLVSGSMDGSSDAFLGTQAVDGCRGEKEENFVPSGKESMNLQEQGSDMKVERCLEAEKKRLLAELQVGTRFKANVEKVASGSDFFRIDKYGNGCRKQPNTMGKMRIRDDHLCPNHAFVGGSLKVEVIDDTALIDAVLINNKGKDHRHKNIGEKPVDGKQGKRIIRKGKENAAKMVEGNNNSVRVSDIRNLGQKNVDRLKMTYTRKQMEAMRFANTEGQRNLWIGIYNGLAPEVATEYEGLICLKGQKNPLPNCVLRQPILKRDRAVGILGTLAAVPRRTHLNAFVD